MSLHRVKYRVVLFLKNPVYHIYRIWDIISRPLYFSGNWLVWASRSLMVHIDSDHVVLVSKSKSSHNDHMVTLAVCFPFPEQPRAWITTGPQQQHATFYEFRTYYIQPHLNAAFLRLTNEKIHLRTAHSELIGYWSVEYGGLNQVFHIWKYGENDWILEHLIYAFKTF